MVPAMTSDRPQPPAATTSGAAGVSVRRGPKPVPRNTCSGCGCQPDWHDFEAVVDAYIYTGGIELARGRVAARDWRRAVDDQQCVICWVPDR